jgi:hypothetical protein
LRESSNPSHGLKYIKSMDLFKRISSAVLLALLIALPLTLLESLMVYSIIRLYEIPYLINFAYYQVLGISFIMMMTRNRIRMPEENEDKKDFMKGISYPSLNRLFRVLFVWCVALIIHLLFLR